ncbi:mycofactocin biosynthesis peptidyl-dipeptidase MftE [Nocardioides sp. WS12]|uniref:mycofactocin biosynthesis peptidyl-dipeptidase MftE n=1 Tax=Nocardioides sp. WS12 TaxID=2486272 RepID=UPI0015F84771|nr:mycofactocin biosynthesis peptidyl-dipeptidase MftE [Nocardioides sp. WS12]
MELSSTVSPRTAGTRLVLVPVGSLEQHGPHLPLDTDTVIATAVAKCAAERLNAWVAPAIAYGSSGEHQSFPGTVSVGTEALAHTVIELVRSMRTWAGRVLLVNGHGGNITALKRAVDQLTHEGHDVDWVACRTEQEHGKSDLHAGFAETSLMLHLHPWDVRVDLAEVGDTRPLAETLPLMMSGGVAAVSANGVLGDPTGATAGWGAQLFELMVTAVVAAAWPPVNAAP